jgi:subtilase family serine protease
VSKVSDIELTPPPDLQVTVNAPNNAFSGQYTSLSWTVTNEGQGRTLQSSWYDEVYLSTDKVLDGSDKPLGRQNHSGILEPGAGYTVSNTTRLFKLPEGISGDYYFLVRTDAGKQVYESALAANNTGHDPTPTKVFLTPPPDLEISVDAPNNALASHNLTLNYRLSNNGATVTPYGRWTNAFYLSVDDQLDSGDLLLGSRNFTGSLDLGGELNQSFTLELPNGISGQYYLFAKADSNDEVFELDNDNNLGFDPITIDSKPADLIVSEVTAPEQIEAGTGTQISWTVVNQGTGDTVKTNWEDRLWLSVDSVIGNSDDRILKTFTHNGLLNAGASYRNSELITVPFDLQGNYQLYLQTDGNHTVYEADKEVNNTSVFSPIAITRKTPDLQVTAVTAPLTGVSGESLVVDWSVANLGTGKTNSNYWYDEVFLSLDRDLDDGSDISLGKVYHSGSLDPNGKYDASQTFKLPQNLDKNYHVIVRTDTNHYYGGQSEDRVIETPLENNNVTATSSKTSISLNSVPDLVIEQLDAPAEAISGQSFNLNWTVRNQGAEVNSSWHDVFYLSRDQVFDRNDDLYLGSSFHYGKLAAGAESSKTASLNIPRGLSGPFYVFAVTDSGDDIYERNGEDNNIAFDGNSLRVILPPPADLGNGNINLVSDTATSGDFIALNYTVQSLGTNPPVGIWTDSIYLSADDQWDINDLLLTKVKTSASSIVNGGYTRNVNAKLPGVVPGDYHLIVRSDILNEISESNENNNVTVSAETIKSDIPSLEIGTAINGTLNQGQEVYYRVDVASGETLQFVLDSLSDNAVNELYVSYGKMPTRADFDFGFEDIAADQDIVIPVSEAGTYYILARGQYVPGLTQDYSLAVNTIDFGITELETKVGDKGGEITFAIEGAKFNSNLTAALENEAGEIIEATNIWYEDSTKVFATFDLSKAAIGDYNLKVSQPSIESDFIENEAGEMVSVLKETTLSSVVEDGFKVVSAKEEDLLVTVTSTPRVSPGQYFDIVLNYANNGTHDIEAPLLHLEANQDIGFANIQDGDEFIGNNSMTLLGISNEGAAGVLRPGEVGTIRLRGRAVSEGSINITASQVVDDGTALDYERFINEIGGDIEDPAWFNAAKALEEQFGTSWSSFGSGLAALATENSASGKYSHSVSELWTDVALEAWSDGVSNGDNLGEKSVSSLAKKSSNLLSIDSLSKTIEEPLVDTENPPEVQSRLELEERVVNDAANIIKQEFNAPEAAKALGAYFAGQPGLENPPSLEYQSFISSSLGENLLDKKLSNRFFDVSAYEINQWKNHNSIISYFDSVLKHADHKTSKYKYNFPYQTTFYEPKSSISEAIRKSSSYQNKIKDSASIEKN